MLSSSATFQQRIRFNGSEDSIDRFTVLLKDAKDLLRQNSAEVLLEVIAHWKRNGSWGCKCTAAERRGYSRVFYLQVLTSNDVLLRIDKELEKLRCDYYLKSLLDRHNVGRSEFLLEAMILILENFKKNPSRGETAQPPTVPQPAPRHIRASSVAVGGDSTPRPKRSVRATESQAREAVPAKSWRQRIREQQLEENKRLRESVRSACDRERRHSLREAPPPTNRYTGRPSSIATSSVSVRSVLQNTQNIDKQESRSWEPVHNVHMKTAVEEVNARPPLMKEDKENARPPRSTKTEIDASKIHKKYDLNCPHTPKLSMKQRKHNSEALGEYLFVQPPDFRETPGYPKDMTHAERTKEGVDCDEVFPGLVLGNGATLKNKEYLKRIGISHVLNAAEFRGVNVDAAYFQKDGDEFEYKGIRVEDTPQTQICRYNLERMTMCVSSYGFSFRLGERLLPCHTHFPYHSRDRSARKHSETRNNKLLP